MKNIEELKKIVILIDAENAQLSKLKPILDEISTHGHIIVKKAFGDWTNPSLKRIAINSYTSEGREEIRKRLACVNTAILTYLMRSPVRGKSAEYNDNRLSLYCGQAGQCAMSGQPLEIGRMPCRRIKPVNSGGGGEHANLAYVRDRAHRLIHAATEKTALNLLKDLNPDKNQIAALNKFRAALELPRACLKTCFVWRLRRIS
jgi:hypothetical protein